LRPACLGQHRIHQVEVDDLRQLAQMTRREHPRRYRDLAVDDTLTGQQDSSDRDS
jgi:hypothetical protein